MTSEYVNINGLNIGLGPAPDESLITDVVIIRRYVHPEHNSDGIMIASSDMTSGVTATGMLTIATHQDQHIWQEG